MEKQGKRDGNEKRSLRKEWVAAVFALLMATALPALTAYLFGLEGNRGVDALSEETSVVIFRHGEEAAEEMTLERALILSLAATNPSDTPAASLEAQAVVLRSRAVWWMGYCNGDTEQGSGEAGNGRTESPQTEGLQTEDLRRTLCDSPAHGLPYRSESELTAILGAEETTARIAAAEQAAASTRGQVLCFEGEVIPAMIHTSSAGATRTVEELSWLCSVTTPEEAVVAVCRVDAEDARAALAARFGLLLSADPTEWEISVTTDSGITESVRVGGETLAATVIADALSLPSGNFVIEAAEDALVITCMGEGSGCGLSRAGADVYARGGLSWGEILAHYYPDCTLGRAWE
ncbi:MAG: hypothetical protein IJX76_08255 [Clostridia bacterium]|nr:hypothetical protein [Clostridia bacterium]